MTNEMKEFINLDEFDKIKKIAEYFVEQKALPKGVDNAGKLVMVIQAGRDLGLSITQSMSGIALINGVITVFGNVGALMMKRAGYDWKVIESTSKHCKIKIWKGEDEKKAIKIDEVDYDYEEAKFAGILRGPWLSYPQDMVYRKCIARARKRICPEVMEGVAIYEDYQEIDRTPVDEAEVLKNFGKAEELPQEVLDEQEARAKEEIEAQE